MSAIGHALVTGPLVNDNCAQNQTDWTDEKHENSNRENGHVPVQIDHWVDSLLVIGWSLDR
jgi:hypothetical protein